MDRYVWSIPKSSRPEETSDRLLALQLQREGFNSLSPQVIDDQLLAWKLHHEESTPSKRQQSSSGNSQQDLSDHNRQEALDRQLAEQLSQQSSPKKPSGDDFKIKIDWSRSVIDPCLEIEDPVPDIWDLYRQYDEHFFNGVLVKNGVQLSWSPRMTLCAGVCAWNGNFCEIRLSKPLLQLRPRSDLVETLLHEMIHALLFVSRINDNHESHGEEFHRKMHEINKLGKCKISVYHNFHAEVSYYQKHVWRCSGPCLTKSPYYGYVRRATNRAPGPNDKWWSQHQSTCTGKFVKIEEPEKSQKTKTSVGKSSDIREFFKHDKEDKDKKQAAAAGQSAVPTFVPFSGKGRTVSESQSLLVSADRKPPSRMNRTNPIPSTSKTTTIIEIIEID
ncbi:DNA-dependent metalloprotease SPRTN [Halotydeus destructor]|nr:DNA-dependent metalloprotease SPRTN [Halotydeus destructor]